MPDQAVAFYIAAAFCLVKLVKHMFLHLFSHANTGICYCDADSILILAHFYRYKTAGRGEFDPVGKKIGPDLEEQVFISVERYFRKL